MSEKKYYTPELNEFHVGFIYEIQHTDTDKWESNEFELDDFNWAVMEDKYMKAFRIKHLDDSDITSLGFSQESYDSFEKPVAVEDFNHEEYLTTVERRSDNKFIIWYYKKGESITLFKGTIKNKSELKKLLNQLGI